MGRLRARWLVILGLVALVGVLAVVALSRFRAPPPVVIVTPPPTPRLVVVATPVTPEIPAATPLPPQTRIAQPGTTLIDLDALAPPGQARDIMMMECGNCHSFVCIMRQQRTHGHWTMIRSLHVDRHWTMLDEDTLNTLFAYLESNFNENSQLPKIPDALKDQGCTTPAIR
jgi:hypothetical protein